MKTKFLINSEIFLDGWNLEEAYNHFDKFYKETDFILDKDNEDVYMLIDKEIHLNEGDRIDLGGNFKIIVWKCTDIINETIIYSLEDE